jgi:hypothetical protein
MLMKRLLLSRTTKFLLPLVVITLVFVFWNRSPGRIEQHLKRLQSEGVPTTTIELNAWYPKVPDDPNAALMVLNSASLFREIQGEKAFADFSRGRRDGTNARPLAEVKTYYRRQVETNAEAYAALHEALSHPRARYPVDLTQGWMTRLSHLTPIQPLANRLQMAIEVAIDQGRLEDAVNGLEDEIRLARTLEQEPLMISHLVQIDVEAIGLKSAETVLEVAKLGDAQLRRMQTVYEGAATSLSYERAMVGQECMILSSLRLPPSELAKFATLASSGTGNDIFSELEFGLYSALDVLRGRDVAAVLDVQDPLRLSARLPPERKKEEIRRIQFILQEQIKQPLAILSRQILPSMESTPLKSLHLQTQLQAAAVACAVERWRLKHTGKLPSQLGLLLPDYLSALPVDPMDGKSLKYQTLTNGYVVYGVSEEGVDHSGQAKSTNRGRSTAMDYPFTVRYGRK